MIILNKKAFHDYIIEKKIEAGIKLTGAETKSVKGGRINLGQAYVKIIGSEAYLVNAVISLYPFARAENYQADRTRKLLLHKKEIISLKSMMEGSNLTIVPLKCYTAHGLVKLELGLARGKKKYDKREELRKRTVEREIARIVKRNY